VSIKGGGSKQIVGFRYIMAQHSGISRGPVNEFCEIRVGDLAVWTGGITESGFDAINAPDAFGGDEKEGGIVGNFKIFMGEATQTIDSIIIDQIEGDQPVPGWRGVLSLFFYGQIGSNNPYPKSWKFRVRRTTKGWDDDDPWYADKALIVLTQDAMVTLTFTAQPNDEEYITINGTRAYFREAEAVHEFDVAIGDSIDQTATNLADMVNFYSIELDCTAVASGNVVELRGLGLAPVVETPFAFITSLGASGDIHGMNPAHIIYECATNKVWGRGLPRAMLDDVAFRAAADTLYAENFGLCIRWNREDNIDSFVQNVIDHIGAAVYVDRQTGLLRLKLIRKDYDASAMTAYTFDNGILDITEDQVSSRDTMVNEVIVSFNDPVSDKIGSVRVQNLASFQSIGSVVSTTVEYLGCATATAALRLAQRDLEMHSSQLRRLTLKMTRAAWKVSPGDAIKISVPQRGIDSMILRVGEVEESALTGEEITLKAVEDVFDLPDNTIVDPQESFWLPPDRSARVITDRDLTEQTYFDLADNLPSSQLADFAPNEGWIKMYAAQPNGAAVQYDLQTKAGGELAYVTRSTAGFDAIAYLVGDISHYQTNLTFERGSLLSSVAAGALVRIGDEYFRLDDIDRTAGTLTVARGCADTIPQLHLDKARIWFQTALPTTDFRDYATGEVVSARLLTRTTSQTLDPAFAYEDSITMASRQGRPYPPGKMMVNGDPVFDQAHVIAGDIALSWAHRDRIVQGNTLLDHAAGSTGPEPGTTYTVRVYGPDAVTLLHTEAGLSSTSWTYTSVGAISDGNPGVMWFWVESVRDGYLSLQHYWFSVSRPFTFDSGFDFDFDGSI
jgi:hypothetical protein